MKTKLLSTIAHTVNLFFHRNLHEKHLQLATNKYNEKAHRIVKGRLQNEPVRSWSFPFKYVPDDPNNFVNIPEPVPI